MRKPLVGLIAVAIGIGMFQWKSDSDVIPRSPRNTQTVPSANPPEPLEELTTSGPEPNEQESLEEKVDSIPDLTKERKKEVNSEFSDARKTKMGYPNDNSKPYKSDGTLLGNFMEAYRPDFSDSEFEMIFLKVYSVISDRTPDRLLDLYRSIQDKYMPFKEAKQRQLDFLDKRHTYKNREEKLRVFRENAREFVLTRNQCWERIMDEDLTPIESRDLDKIHFKGKYGR